MSYSGGFMKNYIINNATIAILKQEKRTIIYDVENIRVINKHTRKLLEENCLFYGSSMEGRIKSAKNILNIKYKVPIIISESDNLTLIPVNAMRSKECLFLVASKIIDYKALDDKEKMLVIRCVNNLEFTVNLSKKSFDKLLLNSIKLNNYLKWLK